MCDSNDRSTWSRTQISVRIPPDLIDDRYCEKSKLKFCQQMTEYLNIMYQIDSAIVKLDEAVSDVLVYCNYHDNIALIKRLITYTIKQKRFPFFSHIGQTQEKNEEPASGTKIKVLINPNSINNEYCKKSKLKICQQMRIYLNRTYQINDAIVTLDLNIKGIKIESSRPDQVSFIKNYLFYTLKKNEFSFSHDEAIFTH